MKEQVVAYKNKEVVCKVTFDQTKYLPEFDETEGSESCLGGVFMHAKKGRIVCSNTLDERLQLCYAEGIPDIRRILFPSM